MHADSLNFFELFGVFLFLLLLFFVFAIALRTLWSSGGRRQQIINIRNLIAEEVFLFHRFVRFMMFSHCFILFCIVSFSVASFFLFTWLVCGLRLDFKFSIISFGCSFLTFALGSQSLFENSFSDKYRKHFSFEFMFDEISLSLSAFVFVCVCLYLLISFFFVLNVYISSKRWPFRNRIKFFVWL